MPDIKPNLSEVAEDDHGMFMAAAHIATLLQNPDTILRDRGHDLSIYDELLRDDQVKSTFEQRRNAVVGAETEVIPASDSAADKLAAEFIEQQLEKISWDEKCDMMLYGRFYGWAVAECMWSYNGSNVVLDDILVRNRARFRFNRKKDLFLLGAGNVQGEKMPDRKFWTFSAGGSHNDNPYGQGLAHSIYWPVFFKRNGVKFWLIFLEKFGMPTTLARLPSGQMDDPKKKAKALAVLRSIQVDSGIVVPDDINIELLEAARSGTADYDVLCERMDKAISKVVVGQTMTTDDGSSRSQAQVHKQVGDEVSKADADLLCNTFNNTVVRWLIDWNFPEGTGYPKVWRKVEPPQDLLSLAERDNKISTLGYEPTEEYVAETYGPGWKKKEITVLPARGDGLGPMGPEFSELSAIAQKRIAHRQDQEQLINAAEAFATKYKNIIGSRVESLLQYAEDSQDYETFRKHLQAMLDAEPDAAAVDAIEKASLFSRLSGFFRGQR